MEVVFSAPYVLIVLVETSATRLRLFGSENGQVDSVRS